MKASYNWLRELTGIDAAPEEVGARLTSLGLEVEDVERFGEGLDHVVIAEVRAVEKVPDKDKLNLVTVFDGEGERKVICGAPNVPQPGGRVVLAKPGAVLPGGFAIAERDVGGVTSSGMLCSETELGIGEGEAGILVLGSGEPGRAGQLAAEALKLQDCVFEIGLTPNRPDCLGHIGLARELALAFGQPFRMPKPGFPARLLAGTDRDEGPDELEVISTDTPIDTLTLVDSRPAVPGIVPIEIEDAGRCPRYAGCVVQGVTVGPSPFWLRYRLFVLGVRSIDNVVDLTNLVLFETGHPIHAFDMAKLRGGKVTIRTARAGERMTTLDGIDRELTSDDLMICDAEGPIAVAGVMGGENSEIGKDTRDVLVEVAYFEPTSVRRTSRRMGLHTDASHRFERGVDPNAIPWVIRRTASLLSGMAGGASAPAARDIYPAPIGQRQVDYDPGHASRLIGIAISEAESRAALEGVGCSISPGETKGWRVSCPTWRPDLSRPEDLVEEIGRVKGFDSVPTELPRVSPSGRGLSPLLRTSRRLRESGAALGLLEAVNYAFVSRAEIERTRVDSNVIELANPLSDERCVMRTSLLPGLLSDVARAHRHQAGSVQVFELARVYLPAEGEALPREPARLGVALAGPRVDHIGEGPNQDFYDGKGMIESLIEGALGVAVEVHADDALDTDAPWLHPRRRARLSIAGRAVGSLGEVHPDITDAYGMDGRAVYAEVHVDVLVEVLDELGPAKAKPLPRFPAVSRDLSLIVDEAVEVGEVARVLGEASGELGEGVELFDVYRDATLGEGKKSLAYRIVYRDPSATLTDKRVEKAHRAVLKAAKQALSARVRE
ncbi:MAG: phenylalanine--tRNA ligase subunit beta [Sandaracinaceae bacterium]